MKLVFTTTLKLGKLKAEMSLKSLITTGNTLSPAWRGERENTEVCAEPGHTISNFSPHNTLR
jgi:hypothetical protein